MSDASLPHCDRCGMVEYACLCELPPIGEGDILRIETICNDEGTLERKMRVVKSTEPTKEARLLALTLACRSARSMVMKYIAVMKASRFEKEEEAARHIIRQIDDALGGARS